VKTAAKITQYSSTVDHDRKLESEAMNIEKARFNMVEQQIRPWNVSDPDVLNLMATLPREIFVPENQRALAFADLAIELPHGQRMFTPREEARMLQSLSIKETDKALEIGTGSGFTAALIASLAKKLITVDLFPDFITEAEAKFKKLNLRNITTEIIDVTKHWTPSERFDVIAITAALSSSPDVFLKRLTSGGRLFCVEGPAYNRYAFLYRKDEKDQISRTRLFEIDCPELITEQKQPDFVF
jgi:protein-L-isoaspartate(D-aspartate) O-methyltransferase